MEYSSPIYNPFQGRSKKVLCVCTMGLLRSPTAAKILSEEYGHNTRSCGTSIDALILVSRELVSWADEIVFMEEWQYLRTKKIYASELPDEIKILDIEDRFSYMDEELIALIKEKYKERK